MIVRRLLWFIFFIHSACVAISQTYPNLNVHLLAHLDPEKDNSGLDKRKYSGCWGWYQSSKNKEYAIVGTSSQTYFIEVTNPSNPIIRDSVKARRQGCVWREIKNYQNFCYIISDDASPNSFQIADMQYLPDSVHVVYDDVSYFERCHTLFVDKDRLYAGGPSQVRNGPDNMHVYSLATPSAPVLLRKLSQDIPSITYVHDMFVRNDTIYASCGDEGLHIIKLNSNNTFTELASFNGYIYSGYNHSSWQTDNRKTMVFTDEVPTGLPAKVIDVRNLDNITIEDTINSHSLATPHNPYIVGNNWCWISSYQDGIYLYDISNPSNVQIYGYFDTNPEHGVNDNFSTNPYRGNWGAYPYLPSQIIITCDMQNGIFILEADNTYKNSVNIREHANKESQFSIYPNPVVGNELTLLVANQAHQPLRCIISDMYGKIIIEQPIYSESTFYKTGIPTNTLSNGCYFITIRGVHIHETKKILIQK